MEVEARAVKDLEANKVEIADLITQLHQDEPEQPAMDAFDPDGIFVWPTEPEDTDDFRGRPEQPVEARLAECEAARLRDMERAADSRDAVVRIRERLRAKSRKVELLEEQVRDLEIERALRQLESVTFERGVLAGVRAVVAQILEEKGRAG